MRRPGFIFLAMLLVVSCAETGMRDGSYSDAFQAKIINTPVNSAAGRLLIKAVPGGCGLDFGEIYGYKISTEPLFPGNNDNISGLDRWYLLTFDPKADMEAIANAVAADERVEIVQYDILIEPIFSEGSQAKVQTRSAVRSTEEMPFNDPELPWQ